MDQVIAEFLDKLDGELSSEDMRVEIVHPIERLALDLGMFMVYEKLVYRCR